MEFQAGRCSARIDPAGAQRYLRVRLRASPRTAGWYRPGRAYRVGVEHFELTLSSTQVTIEYG